MSAVDFTSSAGLPHSLAVSNANSNLEVLPENMGPTINSINCLAYLGPTESTAGSVEGSERLSDYYSAGGFKLPLLCIKPSK